MTEWLWVGVIWMGAAVIVGLFTGAVMHAGAAKPKYPKPANEVRP